MTQTRRDAGVHRAKQPPAAGRRSKSKDYSGIFDVNGMYEIEAFARALGITRQDVVDRFCKRGLGTAPVGELRFIMGDEFYRFLKERECAWGETPDSNREV